MSLEGIAATRDSWSAYEWQQLVNKWYWLMGNAYTFQNHFSVVRPFKFNLSDWRAACKNYIKMYLIILSFTHCFSVTYPLLEHIPAALGMGGGSPVCRWAVSLRQDHYSFLPRFSLGHFESTISPLHAYIWTMGRSRTWRRGSSEAQEAHSYWNLPLMIKWINCPLCLDDVMKHEVDLFVGFWKCRNQKSLFLHLTRPQPISKLVINWAFGSYYHFIWHSNAHNKFLNLPHRC